MRAVPEPDNEIDIKLSCTCKKTKCNKKYCTCFAAGLKCGRDCSCEDCVNCDRPISMEIEPMCIVDEEIVKMEMPESMDFEPFEFRYSNS